MYTYFSRWIGTIAIAAVALLPGLAQRTSISFEHFTSEHGLSAPVVRIIQDNHGFMWLGTTDGLNRFDGRNFIVYRNIAGDTTSLANNIINNLAIDHEGHVWVATNGGACYYDFEDDAFHHATFPENLEKLDRYRVHAVTVDPKGNVWFASRTYIHRWNDGKTQESIPVPGDAILNIKDLYADESGNIWIGMQTGVIKYEPATKKFISVVIETAFTRKHKYTVTVGPIRSYAKDTILIASWYGGIQKVYQHGEQLHAIPYIDPHETDLRKHIIRGLYRGSNNTFWVGTYGNGLSVFNTRTSEFTAHYHHDPSNAKSLSSDYVTDVYTDRSGILWIGTDAGLDKFDPFTQQFQSIPIPEAEGEFSVYRTPGTFVEKYDDPSKLLFTISGTGIYQYNTLNDEFTVFRNDPKNPASLPDNIVYTLYYDNRHRLWVGMKSGLCIADEKLQSFKRVNILPENFSSGIHRILQEPNGNFWFASFNGGIFHYNESNGEIKKYSHDPDNPKTIPDNRVFCLLLDHENMLWVGTQNRGMCRINPQTDEIIFFQHQKNNPQTIPDNGIYDLYEDEEQHLWIATENGLARMNMKDHSFVQFTTKDGMCNNDVFSFTPDHQGYYWLATNNGMSRFDPKQKSFKNYFINDGLPTNRLSGTTFLGSNGTLYLGTSGMITYCKPSMMQINRNVPTVVITNFKVFDQREPIMREGTDLEPIRLSYRQNMITFDFAALNFTNSILNQYAYRLEGFDDQWIYCGNKQSATFTNLDGGHYVFHVKAANNDGVWNETGARVMITVQPPYWETWWFYLLCLVAVSALLYAAYRFRIKQLMKLQQIRLRISRDLHDDIGSTLSSINMISSMAHERNPGERKTPELFQTISNASHQAMELMNDIVWSINPKNDRMEMILIRMRQYASEMLEAAQIPFTLEMDESCQYVSMPIEKRKDFYLIFKEAINNLAKYSKAKHASILLSCSHRLLSLKIEDKGIGFDPTDVHSGNGLKNMKARAQQLKGDILIDSKPGLGTTIELKMPVTP